MNRVNLVTSDPKYLKDVQKWAAYFLDKYKWTKEQREFLELMRDQGYYIGFFADIKKIFKITTYGSSPEKTIITIEVGTDGRINPDGARKKDLLIIVV